MKRYALYEAATSTFFLQRESKQIVALDICINYKVSSEAEHRIRCALHSAGGLQQMAVDDGECQSNRRSVALWHENKKSKQWRFARWKRLLSL